MSIIISLNTTSVDSTSALSNMFLHIKTCCYSRGLLTVVFDGALTHYNTVVAVLFFCYVLYGMKFYAPQQSSVPVCFPHFSVRLDR